MYDYHSDTRWLKTAKFGHVSENNFSYLSSNPFLVDNITYDKNGNLLSLNRNQQSGQAMDRLTYHYKAGLNQLDHVTDGAGTQNLGDIGTQSVGNYSYNSIGQLEENQSEGVTYKYNTAGLTTLVEKDGKLRVGFSYDDKGQRVKKQSYNASGVLLSTTYYVRDASGTPMAIYTKTGNATKLSEVPVYGIQRLGVWNKEGNATKYELTDHLGNVRAVISEEKPTSLLAKTDYYPFGMAMPSRTLAGGYRYAYQGQELDPETGKEAFELRLWDSRLGRWLTPDPVGQHFSPYLGMSNRPNMVIDPDGGCDDGKGNLVACPDDGPGIPHNIPGVEVTVKRNLRAETFLGRYSDSFSNPFLGQFSFNASFMDALAYFNRSKRFSGIDTGAQINGLQAGLGLTIGPESYNLKASGRGSVLSANTNLTLTASKYYYQNQLGLTLDANAGAFVAEGQVSFGFTVFGIQTKATIGASVISAHAGLTLGLYEDRNTNHIVINGLEHLGFGMGQKVGIELRIPTTEHEIFQ